jgi:hypothetical protein
VLGAWFFAKKPGTGDSWTSPLSLLKEIFSKDKACSSDLRWAAARATKNTVFKVIFFKEALSIGSKGSSIRTENQGKVLDFDPWACYRHTP